MILTKANILIAECCIMGVKSGKIPMTWRSCTEYDVRAKVVPSYFAVVTSSTRNARLNSNSITYPKIKVQFW